MDKKTVAALFFVGILAAILIIVFIEHSMNPPEKQPAPVETRQPAVRQAEQGEQVEQAGQAPQAELDELAALETIRNRYYCKMVRLAASCFPFLALACPDRQTDRKLAFLN